MVEAWLVVLGDNQRTIQDAVDTHVVVEIAANYTITEGPWVGYVVRVPNTDRASLLARAFASDYGLTVSLHRTEEAAQRHVSKVLGLRYIPSEILRGSPTTPSSPEPARTNGSVYVAADGTIRSRGNATKRW